MLCFFFFVFFDDDEKQQKTSERKKGGWYTKKMDGSGGVGILSFKGNWLSLKSKTILFKVSPRKWLVASCL